MLVVSNIVSLDGYVADESGNSTALPMDEAFDVYNAERLRSADTLLVGANSYRGFAGFWPAVESDPERVVDDIVAQLGGSVPREEVAARISGPAPQEVARRNGEIAKVVVSDRLREDELGAWRDTTRIVRRADAHAAVAELTGETLIFGSRTLWADLLAAGLVDELHLMVAPVVLGAGVRAFDGPLPDSLQLTGTRRFEGSDNVVLTYRVRRR
jgi:dihydrofolate reductase